MPERGGALAENPAPAAIAAAAIVVREVPRPLIIAGVFAPAAIGTYLLSFGWTAPAEGFSAITAAKRRFWHGRPRHCGGSATAFGRRALRQAIAPNMPTSMRFVLALPFLLFLVLLRRRR